MGLSCWAGAGDIIRPYHPTYGGYSYLWPLFPFNWQALKTLLLRYPTFRAQPSRVWRRRKIPKYRG